MGADHSAKTSEAGTGLAARRLALDLIWDVLAQGKMLSDGLEARAGQAAALPPGDRARAQRLASDALRQMHRADSCLKSFVKTPPKPATRDILRLGTVELCHHGADPHGVVHSAVSLAKADPRTRRQAGLVNAVLRRIAEDGPARWAQLTAPARLPDWLRGRLQSAHGARAVADIEAAHDQPAPLDLTPRDGDAPALAARLGGEALPSGSVRLAHGGGAVSGLPGFETGEWWVQDAAAALPARALATKPGERVLDLCAAPGGKTLQLAAAGAKVTALDISERRLERLRENLARTGLSAEVVTEDALAYEAPAFDAILLDAPCSATGTIRRHPDLPFLRRKSDLPELIALQSALIDKAFGLLRPGGRLIYCTCSLLAAEGEDQITAALERHSDLRLAPKALAQLTGIDPSWLSDQGLRSRPDYWADQGGMDGFFVASLQRAGQSASGD